MRRGPSTIVARAHASAQRRRHRDGLVGRRHRISRPGERARRRPSELFFPPPAEVEAVVSAELAETSLFAGRFRENAARALLLPRLFPGASARRSGRSERAPHDLLHVASRASVVSRCCSRRTASASATCSTCPASSTSSAASRRGNIYAFSHGRHAATPSPFAASLLFSFVANFIYDGDSPLAERRAQALTIDHAQLRELLGEAEAPASSSIPQAIDGSTSAPSSASNTYPAKHADAVALHDMLKARRSAISRPPSSRGARRFPPSEAARAFKTSWTSRRSSMRDRRVARVANRPAKCALIAIEDAGRYRDAVGVALPRGVPERVTSSAVKDALGVISSRAGRERTGPFAAGRSSSTRFGVAAPTANRGRSSLHVSSRRESVVLRRLSRRFLAASAQGETRELCDAEVLRVRPAQVAREAPSRGESRRSTKRPTGGFLIRVARGRPPPQRTGAGRAARRHRAASRGCPPPASALLDARILARARRRLRPVGSRRAVRRRARSRGPESSRSDRTTGGSALFLAEDEPLLRAARAKTRSTGPQLAREDPRTRGSRQARRGVFRRARARRRRLPRGSPRRAVEHGLGRRGHERHARTALRRSLRAPASVPRREARMRHRAARYGGRPIARRSRRSALPGSEGRWVA